MTQPPDLPAEPQALTTTIVVTVVVGLLALMLLYHLLTRGEPPTGIAGPPPYPFIGNVFHLDAHNLPKSFNALHTRYGRVVKLHLGPRVMVSVADAAMAEAIFNAPRGGWSNSDLFRFVFGPLYPRSAIVIEGPEWRRVRRLLHGAVAGGGGGGAWPSGKEGVLPATRAAVERALERLSAGVVPEGVPAAAPGGGSGGSGGSAHSGTHVDMMAWSQEIMFETLGGYAFGKDWRLYPDADAAPGSRAAASQRPLFEAMSAITKALPRRVSRPWRIWWTLPTQENRRVWAAEATIRKELATIIANRRADRARARQPGSPPLEAVPLLDGLLDAGRDSGVSPPPADPISEEDIMDNAATIAFAGTDTTAATLAFLFYHLAAHPKVQADLAAEIEAATAPNTAAADPGSGGVGSTSPADSSASPRGPPKQLSARELDALPLLAAVVSESSRLLPTSFAIPRTPRKDFVYGDMVIPTGTLVIVNVLRMGQDEGLWPAPAPGVTPQDFSVERWLRPDGGRSKRTAYAHLPFGAGDRSCLGRPVALSQIKSIVVQVLAAGWELLPVEGRELKVAIRMALVPEAGAWVEFRRRRP